MRTHLLAVACKPLVSALLFVVLAVSAPRIATAAAVVARPKASPPVTVSDDGDAWTMDNGIVKAAIDKRSSNMTSLIYRGIETMGPGGRWEQRPSGKLTYSLTIDSAQNGGARAEVAVKGVTGGTVMLTPGAPGGGTYCDIEVRYALGRELR